MNEMNYTQINRIEKMEENLDALRDAMEKLEEALNEFETVQNQYLDLVDYYDGELWRADFEADEAGNLPEDLKRGVLSEDAVYNLITEHNELMQRMKEIIRRGTKELCE